MVERLKILKNIKIIEQENQDEEKNDFFDSIRNEVENLLEEKEKNKNQEIEL